MFAACWGWDAPKQAFAKIATPRNFFQRKTGRFSGTDTVKPPFAGVVVIDGHVLAPCLMAFK